MCIYYLVSSASKCGVETKTIAADFSATDIYSKIEDGLAGLEIGILGKIPSRQKEYCIKSQFASLNLVWVLCILLLLYFQLFL